MHGCLPACMYLYHIYTVPMKARKGLDPQGLELQKVVNHHVPAGSAAQDLLTTDPSLQPEEVHS